MKIKTILYRAWLVLVVIGLLDFVAQMASNGSIRIIQGILRGIFG